MASGPFQVRSYAYREVGLFVTACLLCTGMLYFRRPDAFTAPQFYAEEGRNFFAEAWNEGWPSCINGLAGYFHLYPRVLANAALALGVPVLYMPHVFNAGALVAYLLVWFYTFARLPCGLIGRFFGVLATGLVPMGNEVWMNQTNVQWVLALIIPLICFGKPPAGRLARVIDGCVLVVCSLTGPFAVVMAPLLILYPWRAQRGSGWALLSRPPVLLALSAGVTIVELLTFGTVQRTVPLPLPPTGHVQGVAHVLFDQLWFPFVSIGVRSVPFPVQVVAIAAALMFLVLVWRKAQGGARPFVQAALGAAVCVIVATIIGYRDMLIVLSPFDSSIRNFYLPVVLMLWAVLCVPIRYRVPHLWSFSLLFAWWIVQTIVFIGPTRFVDLHWERSAALIGKEAVVVPIQPPGWAMRLERDRGGR